jgi:cysteine-rich secretory family protein
MDWLARVNFYRALAKLQPVTEDAKLSTGDLLHSRYLVKNRAMRMDASGHDEDPANAWFTTEGLAAARDSDVIPPCAGCIALSPAEAIDMWIAAPFHRLSILNPELSRIGFGEFREGSLTAYAISVGKYPKAGRFAAPVMFPADGTVVALYSFPGVEWPAPLTACAGFRGPTGLPVTLELGGNVQAVVEQHRFSEDGRALEHCVFDASRYTNPVPLEQKNGREALTEYGAVVLIPRAPVFAGHRYTVDLRVSGREFSWSFSVGP